MAAKSGDKGTFIDGLKGVYSDVANLALLPDSQSNPQYMQVVQQLQQAILKVIQGIAQQKAQQAAQMQQQQAAQAAQMQGGGMMGGQRPGQGQPPAGPMKGQPGGPPSQGSPGAQMPNPDELRRVLAAQGGGQ